MTEVPKRLAPTIEVAKRLFALSGNRCAFHDCDHAIFDKHGVFIAEVCHIEAAEPGGERFNPSMTNEQRRQIENLMLMCHEHHKVTDDVRQFSVQRMREMKARHEALFEQAAARIVEEAFVDHTAVNGARLPQTMKRYGDAMDVAEYAMDMRDWYAEFADRLSRVPRADRQLLCIIAERNEDGVVTSSELRRVTRSSMEQIWDSLRLLEKYNLISIDTDSEYGPDEIRLISRGSLDVHPLTDLMAFSKLANEPWQPIVVDMRFDLLD